MSERLTDGRDILDSREVIERIEELTSSTVGIACTCTNLGHLAPHDADCPVPAGADPDDIEELRALETFRDEMSDYCPDWEYGETLIHDAYFVTYAQELAEDIGAISSDAAWPNTCIDWEQAARELRMDYTSVELGGHTYWGR